MTSPVPPSRSVAVSEYGVPERLQALRRARGWSRAELADAAGLSTRTVRDLENGRRERVHEKTLLLLAEALELAVEDLLPGVTDALGPTQRTTRAGVVATREPVRAPRFGTSPLRRWAVVLSIFILAIVAASFGFLSDARIGVEVIDGKLVARDFVLGRTLWTVDRGAEVLEAKVHPDRARLVLASLGSGVNDGGVVLMMDRRTGEIVGELRPDFDIVEQAFGSEFVPTPGAFSALDFQFAELDGQAPSEIVVRFIHSTYFPAVLAAYSLQGELLHHYLNRGHLGTPLVEDLDGDGCDEVVAAGTNNAKVHQGGTLILLDDAHWSGVSFDRWSGGDPSLPDSARARVILPTWEPEVMERMQGIRVTAENPRLVPGPAGDSRILANFRVRTSAILVTFDSELRPLSAVVTDALRGEVASWPEQMRGPGRFLSREWIDAWLDSARWFRAGDWPPRDSL